MSPIDIEAKSTTNIDEDEVKQETEEAYDDLLTIFLAYSKVMYVDSENVDYRVNSEMAYRRAESLLMAASSGYKIDILNYIAELDSIKEQLIKDLEDIALTEEERQIKLDEYNEALYIEEVGNNLSSFATYQTHTVLNSIASDAGKFDNYQDFEDYGKKLLSLYFVNYGLAEGNVSLRSMANAKEWRDTDDDEIIIYKTQGDQRVRSSHIPMDNLAFRKSTWSEKGVSIPNGFGCRCYWLATGGNKTDGRKITASRKDIDKIIKEGQADPLFKDLNTQETGVIFSPKHPYFDVDKKYVKSVQDSVREVRESLGLPN